MSESLFSMAVCFSSKLKIKLRQEVANSKNKFQQKQSLVLQNSFLKLNHIQKKTSIEVATEPLIRKRLIPELTFLVRAGCLKITSEGIKLH